MNFRVKGIEKLVKFILLIWLKIRSHLITYGIASSLLGVIVSPHT